MQHVACHLVSQVWVIWSSWYIWMIVFSSPREHKKCTNAWNKRSHIYNLKATTHQFYAPEKQQMLLNRQNACAGYVNMNVLSVHEHSQSKNTRLQYIYTIHTASQCATVLEIGTYIHFSLLNVTSRQYSAHIHIHMHIHTRRVTQCSIQWLIFEHWCGAVSHSQYNH